MRGCLPLQPKSVVYSEAGNGAKGPISCKWCGDSIRLEPAAPLTGRRQSRLHGGPGTNAIHDNAPSMSVLSLKGMQE